MNLLNLADIFMGSKQQASQNARSQWEMARADRQDQAQQDALTQQKQGQSLLAELYANGPEAAPGVEEKLIATNPQLYVEWKQQQAKSAGVAQGRMVEGEKLAANLQRAMAAAPTPQARAAIEQRAFEMHKRGMIPRIEVSGPQSGAGDVQGLGAQADAVLGAKKPEDMHLDAVAKTVMHARGLQPGQPGFSEAYESERQRQAAEEMRLRRAGATQVNVNGKDLPASSVAELGDVDFLRHGVGGLLESFTAAVPAEGLANQVEARGRAEVPNTDVANFNMQADMFAQKLGTTLEGGKLTDADYQSKYRNMVPRPGDSPETAKRKTENIDRLLSGYSQARESAYTRAGYRAPSPKDAPAKQAPAPKPPPVIDGATPGQLAEQLMASGRSPQAIANQVRARFKLTAEQAKKLQAKLTIRAAGERSVAATEGIDGP